MSNVKHIDLGRIGVMFLMTVMSLAAGLIMTAVGIEGLIRNKRRCSKSRSAEKERSVIPVITVVGILLIILSSAMFFIVNMIVI